MIRNMVFDMGRVLLDYDPVGVCRHYTEDESAIGVIRKELFESEEWKLLDLGAIGEEEALRRVFERVPGEELRDLARKSLEHWHEFNLSPKPGMEELVRELKEKGFGIYLCSNASLRLRVFEWMIPGIEYFDGTLVSAEEGLVKPDPAIYRRLFETFSLKPEECFFIDDLPANIAGAEQCGMKGYCFADGDVERLRSALRERGIL